MAIGRKTGGRVKGQSKIDELKAFARRIETRVTTANIKDAESMERVVCRIITQPDKNPAVAAMLTCKWVEWRYGKPKESIELSGTVSFTETLQRIRERKRAQA